MNNVLRVLGIVGASIVLGLDALFLSLFTICGGLQSSDGPPVLVVCGVIFVGSATAIVLLGRNLSRSQLAGPGLAVPPAYAAGPAAVPTTAPPPLTGVDQQVLIGLRIALGIYLLAAIGSMILNFVNMRTYGSAVAIQLSLRNVLNFVAPAAVLLFVCVRNPPPAWVVDAAAGMGIASVLFRVGWFAYMLALTPAFSSGSMAIATVLVRMLFFTAIEGAIVGLALRLRGRVGAVGAAGVVVATIAFLFWEGLIEATMTMLIGLMF